jgi:hypothetical protein
MMRQACDVMSIESPPALSSLLAFNCFAFPLRFFSDEVSNGTVAGELSRRFLGSEN